MFFNVFIYPTRLKLALLPARILQWTGIYGLLRDLGVFKLLPSQLRKMEQMLPAEGKLWPGQLPEKTTPRDATKAKRVGFVAGCIGSVMFEKVNRQAVQLLAAAGAEVIAPHAQGCCGAIHHHNGAHHPAEALAKHNIDTFLPKNGPQVDYIATCIAGCGAMLREYDFLLRDDVEYRDRAKLFASKVRDVSEVLFEIGLPNLPHAVNETVTYHDACHLAHAQKVIAQPRALLAKIPGLKLIPLPESDMCCGAAGTYNLTQPKMSSDLAARKLRTIASTRAKVCVTGNVGCAMQIQSEAEAKGEQLKVVHPVELLHRAAFGDRD
jgi:glycolate oxidase iron-sulfur subunit